MITIHLEAISVVQWSLRISLLSLTIDNLNYLSNYIKRESRKIKRRQNIRDLSRLFKPDTYGFPLYKSYPFYKGSVIQDW